jgi:hypothetical protein
MTPILGIMASAISGNLWAPSKDFDSIATVTVGAAGASSIDFTSIPSTYRHLQIRGIGRGTTASANLDMSLRFNSDATSGNYFWHRLYGEGTTAFSNGTVTTPAQGFFLYGPAASATASVFGTAVVDVLDYTSANKYKTIRSLWGYDANGSGFVGLGSVAWANSSTAVNAVSLICASGNFAQYSQFALYGVK